jgi:acetolactate decarboxylase
LTRQFVVSISAITLIAVIAGSAACIIWDQRPNANSASSTLYQIQAFNNFSQGNFAGNTTFAELAKHGNFGIGTLNGLDGEMIAFNGTFYQIPSSGVPRQITPQEKTPYATVCFFKPELTIENSSWQKYSELISFINSSIPDHTSIYAIKVDGIWGPANTRSPPIQTEPYPNLTQALVNQSLFTINNFDGTAIGFYFPSYMNGIDYAGYHLHMITDDRKAGGHLLDCNIRNATIELEKINHYELVIP